METTIRFLCINTLNLIILLEGFHYSFASGSRLFFLLSWISFLSFQSFDFIVNVAFVIEEALQAFNSIKELEQSVTILVQM